MDYRKHISALGFTPKDGTTDIYTKLYQQHRGYYIDVDFKKEEINYNEIVAESKTTQNFSQAENFVVLECVDRLLKKGYKPQNIILEKTWPSGHGTSGRLDILVNREDGTPYMLIECKTYGKEFDKELNKTCKDGGQLFTYFQLSGCKADVIMLYASEIKSSKVIYRNEIIKIEDEYRSGDVKDIFEKWNKLTKDNGIFDTWTTPYNFKSQALTLEQLEDITSEKSSFIFNRFLEILRHNVVSDKGNAFNKIFTLFLCKVYDETTTEEGEELAFQWKEGVDNHVDFQLRLNDLYSKGMQKFLERTVSDFNKADFDNQCAGLPEEARQYLLKEVNKLRLEKNNEFAIKEVYDHQSFLENAKVVKEVVELLQGYRIRYNKRQQYLSDFFELLLTTGLKQESGQFFTPVPIAQFIIKSLPLDKIVEDKLRQKDGDILPYMIDYAAGSGHFITEYMHEVQSIVDKANIKNYLPTTAKKIRNWQEDHFDWATDYVYGIEKDYRLVKVGKVGCYLHGDGLANVILSDGLSNFSNKEYKGKLSKSNDDVKDNQQFDIVLSNPPYSVSSFKQTTRDYYTERDFELYKHLTDNSSEIECLFMERTKQLLKDGGVVGVILPSSILSNTGIYSRAREMILNYFDIVAITELGSNTFMATGTNTVVLFLRRRNNFFARNIGTSVENYLKSLSDVTINGIETPAEKYVAHVWEGLSYADYVTLLQGKPNEAVQAHEIFVEYKKRLKVKTEEKLISSIIEIEREKIIYFIITYNQNVVIVKSGEKNEEKQFLGYEFSNRRGSEGIHPLQRGKSIEECTQLFDANSFDNPDKASTYIYKAFQGDYGCEISEAMQKYITRTRLVDMLSFDRVDFEKNISTSVKKKVRYEEIWSKSELFLLSDIADIKKGTSITKEKAVSGNIPVVAGGQDVAYYHNSSNRDGNIITISASGAYSGFVNYFNEPIFASDCNTVISKDENKISTKLLFLLLKSIQSELYSLQRGQAQPHVYGDDIAKIKLPLPPKDVQVKIVEEIESIEANLNNTRNVIKKTNEDISSYIEGQIRNLPRVSIDKVAKVLGGKRIPKEYSFSQQKTEYPYIRVSNFKNNTIDMLDMKYIECNVFEKIKNYTISSKDVYISIAGTIGLVGTVPAELSGKSLTENAAKFIIDESIITKEYLKYILLTDDLQLQIENNTKAVGVPKLALKRIEKLMIPLASLEEQQKIVSQIEKLEAQIAEAQSIIDKAPEQKQAILKKYL